MLSTTKEEFKMMSIVEVKEQATILKNFLKQNNLEITHTSCLQAIAKINGVKDWNTMSAMLQKHEVGKSTEINNTAHVLIYEPALKIMIKLERENKFNVDAHTLLNFFLNKLLNDSMHVLFRFEYLKELGEGWTRHRLSGAMNQLLNAKFIDINSDFEGEMIYINPSFFWKGSPEANNTAINDYENRIALSTMGGKEADITTVTYTGRYGEPSLQRDDMVEFVTELRNQSKYYNKKVPELFFDDLISPEEHPELLKLQAALKKEKAVADPRVYYPKIKSMLESKYYVGHGGAHIHIKSLDELNEIALIVGGIG